METTETKKASPADRRFVILLGVQCMCLAFTLLLVLLLGRGPSAGDRAKTARDTAAKLQAAGLTREAIRYYEDFLKEPGIDAKTRAGVAYSLAAMYEEEGQPDRALGWYYQADNADSPQNKEAAKRIVALLERLGRHQAAKSVLASATAIDKGGAKDGKVVAQIGEKKVTNDDIDAAFDSLPPQLKQAFDGAQGKQSFLKKYVADEVLLEKAKRLQYDSDPKMLKQMEEIRRQLLVNRILNEEVLSKVTVDEKDLKNYFEANKARYAQNKKTPPYEKVRQSVEQDYRMEKSQAKYQELVETLAAGDNIKIFPENVK